MKPDELKTFIEKKIAASRGLNFFIEQVNGLEIVLRSPLQPHLNHKGTAFGGNLYSLSTVTAYSLLLNLLMTHNCYTDDIVIAEGNIKYFKPVTSEIVIRGQIESPKTESEIIAAFNTGKRIPIVINASIFSGELECAKFVGRFAAKVDN